MAGRRRGRDPGPLTARDPATGREVSPLPFVGMIGMASTFFLYAATPVVLDAPWWAVAALLGVWAVALVVAVRWFTRRPLALAWLPLGLAVLWFGTVLAGARFLDWV